MPEECPQYDCCLANPFVFRIIAPAPGLDEIGGEDGDPIGGEDGDPIEFG